MFIAEWSDGEGMVLHQKTDRRPNKDNFDAQVISDDPARRKSIEEKILDLLATSDQKGLSVDGFYRDCAASGLILESPKLNGDTLLLCV